MHPEQTKIDPFGQKCTFSKIQDGGGRHLEFRKMLIVSANMKRFSPNFISMHLAQTNIDPLGKNAHFSKSKMAAAAILNLEKC